MARPVKTNADYFTHDNDMRNDPKIKAARRRFGRDGYCIYNMLLEVLTDSDGFVIKYTDMNIELLSGDFEIEPELLKEIMEYYIKFGLLSLHDGMIFSDQHIKRFNGLVAKREKRKQNYGVPNDTNSLSTEFRTSKTQNKEVYDAQNTQSRVEYSRVEESREEKSKEYLKKDTEEKILEVSFLPDGESPDLSFSINEEPLKIEKEKSSAKKEKGPKSKDHLFSDSEYYQFEKFEAQFIETDYQYCDLKYYYESVKNWAASKAVKKVDWIATARGFMLRDKKDGKLSLRNGTQQTNSNITKSDKHNISFEGIDNSIDRLLEKRRAY